MDCPLINKDFQSGDIEEIKDVDSWGECGIFMHFICLFSKHFSCNILNRFKMSEGREMFMV